MIGVGLVWLATRFLRPVRQLSAPLCLLVFGAMLVVGPAVLTRTMSIDLGKRERIVGNERHISLTGWDGKSYEFLSGKPDTVVLQMANQDVDDETLDFVAKMNQLRELDLNDSAITDGGLPKLAKLPSLETLRLRATKITDAGFRDHLFEMETLRQLDLRQTLVEVETVEEWKRRGESRRAFR